MKSFGSMSLRTPAVSFALLFGAVFLLLTGTGCNGVRRRLTIRTDPPGATVWINDQEIGRTPISHNVTYSGTYKIRLAMEGKKTKTVMYAVKTPWYLWPGVDFISENLVPGELRDQQICEERMEPDLVAAPEELFENAAQMRQEAHAQADLNRYSPQQTSATEKVERLSESGWVKPE
ncbi:MAG: PEGA domain-containing protein [Thermoguttaceae bacterium]|nr:PEGA domain-containing protein [Thermoguttaceae bacterium]